MACRRYLRRQDSRLDVGSVLGPPVAAAIEPLLTAHLCPRLHEAGIAGLRAATDELSADLHGPVNQVEQFGALGDVQPVALGNRPQPMSPVGIMPAEPGSAHVIVDRNAHARKAGEIEQRSAGGSEVEVDQSGCLSVSKDDALDGLDLAQAENALRRAVGPVLVVCRGNGWGA